MTSLQMREKPLELDLERSSRDTEACLARIVMVVDGDGERDRRVEWKE